MLQLASTAFGSENPRSSKSEDWVKERPKGSNLQVPNCRRADPTKLRGLKTGDLAMITELSKLDPSVLPVPTIVLETFQFQGHFDPETVS